MMLKRYYLRKFVFLVILTTIAVVGIFSVIYKLKVDELDNSIKISQKLEADSINVLFKNFIKEETKENIEFANRSVVINSLKNRDKKSFEELTKLVYNEMLVLGHYKQFRLLDNTGKEVFNIVYTNSVPKLISQDKLQDKSHRYYYVKAQNLKRGEVFISDFDYNKEYGKLEMPIQPVIRISSPIYSDDEKVGYLVINYNGIDFFKIINTFEKLRKYNIYVTSTSGKFLFYKNKEYPLSNLLDTSTSELKKILNNPLTTTYNQNDSNLIHILIETPSKVYHDKLYILQLTIFGLAVISLLITILIEFLVFLMLSALASISFQIKQVLALFENSNDAVVIFDKNLLMKYINPAFEKLFKINKNDFLNKTMSSFKSFIHDKAFYDDMWTKINIDGSWSGNVVDIDSQKNKLILNLKIERVDVKPPFENVYIGIYKDLTDSYKQDSKIKKLKYYDAKTGLPNKASLHKHIETRLKLAKENNSKIAYASIGIADLKEINDIYGFSTGDKLLSIFSDRVKNLIDKTDFFSYLGSNQFVLVSEYNDFESYNLKIENIEKNALANNEIISGFEIEIKTKYGISIYPDNGKDLECLIHTASIAANNISTGCINYFTKELSLEIEKKNSFKCGLKSAIDNNEFYLVYQPKVNSKDNSLVGAEALIRWKSPNFGEVSPYEFISIAEEIGIITDITKWVISEVCIFIKKLKVANLPIVPISLNVSGEDFKSKGLIEHLLAETKKYSIDKKLIEIEVTESFLIEDTDKAIATLNELKSKGFTILIDDFGTGYSSLSYLQKFDIDVIKVDRAFISKYPTHDDGVLVEVIAQLASLLDKKTVIEGVETHEQIEFLNSLGCNTIQGYYYSKPVKIDSFEKLLTTKFIIPPK